MVDPAPSTSNKYRFVTRSDLNGLACLGLMKMLGMIEEVSFAQPWDIESGRFPLSKRDITANLPYDDHVHLAFNYYTPGIIQRKQIIDYSAASTARVIYNHYGGAEKFPDFPVDLLRAVDKATLAQYQIEDVLQPDGWDLLNFILDPRTGLDRYAKFEQSDEDMIQLIAGRLGSLSVKEILGLPNVAERVEIYYEQEPLFKEQIRRRAEVLNNLVLLDLRSEETLYAGNRFIVYALFPHISLSMTLARTESAGTIEFSIGKSIFNRSSTLHIGRLMDKYGGGGHANAGTCTFEEEAADKGKAELVEKITATNQWEWLT